MTAAALHAAAERARHYPPGNARNWGCRPRFTGCSHDAADLLKRRPELAKYG